MNTLNCERSLVIIAKVDDPVTSGCRRCVAIDDDLNVHCLENKGIGTRNVVSLRGGLLLDLVGSALHPSAVKVTKGRSGRRR